MAHFVDQAVIFVKAGAGGNGCSAFRREANVPKGGPSGGDGGSGGSVIVVADPQLSTLLDFRYQRHYKAERGEDGRNRDQYGKGGSDLLLRVPCGTSIYDADSGELLADLDAAESSAVVCAGGQGGRGNIHFKTPWNRAPAQAEAGTAGEERNLRLELKLIADVGLVGYPSVGKSTFISKVSRARPKIADYPFTTLAPNLGVAPLPGDRSLVVADIPGLIEGAADGAGLGHQFLRHVERTQVLIHLLEAHDLCGPDRDPLSDYQKLRAELTKYAPALADKPEIVVLNKADLSDTQARAAQVTAAFAKLGIAILTMSAATGTGTAEVLEAAWQALSHTQSAVASG